jgi:hypothetical protein
LKGYDEPEILRSQLSRFGPISADAGHDWHTFWNPGDEECRLLEIISPGGFEAMFKEIAENPDAMTGEAAAALDAKYGLDVDYDSIKRLCREHGLSFPE